MRRKADLRPYQQRLVTRLYEHAVTAVRVPMGGGKTAVALTAIRELIDDNVIDAALVIAPKRVATLVWPKEPTEWEHLAGLRVSIVSGSAAQRERAMNAVADVYAVGIDNTQWLVDWLQKHPGHPALGLLVIDELSRFKNPRGKRGKALMQLAAQFANRIGLTGTPRPNGYEDLFRPLQILTAGKLWERSFDRWRQTRFMPLDYHGRKWSIRPEWRSQTINDMRPYWVSIGDDEMPELPELVQIRHEVVLPPDAMKQYAKMERDLLAKFLDRTVLAASAAVATGKMAQLTQGFVYGESGNTDVVRVHAEKADQLVELVEDLDGEPTLVAYEFQEDLRTLRDLYPDAPWIGAGVSDEQADRIVADWNAGGLPLLFLHPASAGHGLNLQHGGSRLIWYALPWSAELYDQTRKRFHRPGQTKRSFEHFIMAKDTIDDAKYARVVEKMTLQDAFNQYLTRI